jgi:MOSC domain-containing protein YiiM
LKTIRDLNKPPQIEGLVEVIVGRGSPRESARTDASTMARVDQVDPGGLRRNLVVSGINLLALKNAQLQVGAALLEIVDPCQPCSRMDEPMGPGGYAAMRGHGGMTARVITTGSIGVGDAVKAQP